MTTAAMFTWPACVLAWAGFLGLALAMDRHHDQVLGGRPSVLRRRLAMLTGWALLGLATAAAVAGWGWSIGLAALWGVLGLAGGGLGDDGEAGDHQPHTRPARRRQPFAHHQDRQNGGDHRFDQRNGGRHAGGDAGQAQAEADIAQEHRHQCHIDPDCGIAPGGEEGRAGHRQHRHQQQPADAEGGAHGDRRAQAAQHQPAGGPGIERIGETADQAEADAGDHGITRSRRTAIRGRAMGSSFCQAEQQDAGHTGERTCQPARGEARAVEDPFDQRRQQRGRADRDHRADGDAGKPHRAVEGERIDRNRHPAQDQQPTVAGQIGQGAQYAAPGTQGLKQPPQPHRRRPDRGGADLGCEGCSRAGGAPDQGGKQDRKDAQPLVA